ncbi:MAG TPA: thioredoxin domain-containing protein [Allosphingosinicella sp.]|nr:thioredoxin domain-containing protein [Allosphingosinicella sp.]
MAPSQGGPALAGWKLSLLAGIGGVLVGALGVSLYFNLRGGAGQAQTEAIVRNYILEHGEILPEAVERMQRRQARAAVLQNREALERPYRSAWAGAENGDVVMVQFFDYACPYCHQINGDVERLLREDNRLKVVWREYPVLGPNSEAAAVASLAAAEQGRWRQFHARMFALGRPTDAVRQQAIQEAGVTLPASPSEAMRTEVTRNAEMARAVGATGTPTFVIGEQVLQGAVGYEALKAAIAEARANRRS